MFVFFGRHLNNLCDWNESQVARILTSILENYYLPKEESVSAQDTLKWKPCGQIRCFSPPPACNFYFSTITWFTSPAPVPGSSDSGPLVCERFNIWLINTSCDISRERRNHRSGEGVSPFKLHHISTNVSVCVTLRAEIRAPGPIKLLARYHADDAHIPEG